MRSQRFHHCRWHSRIRPAQAALTEAHKQRAWHQQWFPSAVNRALGGVAVPDWLAASPVRTALLALARSAPRCDAVRRPSVLTPMPDSAFPMSPLRHGWAWLGRLREVPSGVQLAEHQKAFAMWVSQSALR